MFFFFFLPLLFCLMAYSSNPDGEEIQSAVNHREGISLLMNLNSAISAFLLKTALGSTLDLTDMPSEGI